MAARKPTPVPARREEMNAVSALICVHQRPYLFFSLPSPPETKRNGKIVGMRVTHINTVVPRFGKELPVPLRSERHAGSDIGARLVHRIRRENLVGRVRYREESEERIETRGICKCRLRKFLVSMEESSAAREIEIDTTFRIQMNHRVDGGVENMQISSRHAHRVQRRSINSE